ncbi:hypothetical protein JYT30_00615 [Desulfotalea psychrophila]|nr:hypothetical protein [Desulfotalea psychrophila]
METHSIHLKWDFDHNSVPLDAELTAYRLYKDGIKVCQFDYPYDFEGNCEFVSDNGYFNFTLTAVFDNKLESQKSAPFRLLLGKEEVPRTSMIPVAVLSLLLDF